MPDFTQLFGTFSLLAGGGVTPIPDWEMWGEVFGVPIYDAFWSKCLLSFLVLSALAQHYYHTEGNHLVVGEALRNVVLRYMTHTNSVRDFMINSVSRTGAELSVFDLSVPFPFDDDRDENRSGAGSDEVGHIDDFGNDGQEDGEGSGLSAQSETMERSYESDTDTLSEQSAQGREQFFSKIFSHRFGIEQLLMLSEFILDHDESGTENQTSLPEAKLRDPSSKKIPNELLPIMISFCEDRDLLQLAQVCKNSRAQCDKDRHWNKMLRRKLEETWGSLGVADCPDFEQWRPPRGWKDLYFEYCALWKESVIARKVTSDCCMVVIYGNIYDVTHFLPHHPGTPENILTNAGQNVTSLFEDLCHSDRARQLMKAYCIWSHSEEIKFDAGTGNRSQGEVLRERSGSNGCATDLSDTRHGRRSNRLRNCHLVKVNKRLQEQRKMWLDFAALGLGMRLAVMDPLGQDDVRCSHCRARFTLETNTDDSCWYHPGKLRAYRSGPDFGTDRWTGWYSCCGSIFEPVNSVLSGQTLQNYRAGCRSRAHVPMPEDYMAKVQGLLPNACKMM